MSTLAQLLVALVAALHLFILWFEMFAWETRGPKVFKMLPANLFVATRAMAANQGLYNGFLAAGLLWSLLISDPAWARNVALFFLGCVFVAGLFGAVTVSRRILVVQAAPAALAILVVIAT